MTRSDDTSRPAPAPTDSGRLKDRAVPEPPQMDQAAGVRALVFVLVLVVVAGAVMAGVLALNVIADPYGTVGTNVMPTVTTSDRTVKANRIEALDRAPQLIVLGSSRSMRYEPSYLQKKTGLTAFNAGVNGIGGTADAWAMTQYFHELWPDSRPQYLWLVDVESFVPFEVQGRTAAEPRLGKFVGGVAAAEDGSVDLARAIWQNRVTLFSLATAKDSLRLLVNKDKARQTQGRYEKTILADGVLKELPWRKDEWNVRYPHSLTRYRNLYKNVYDKPDAESQRYFERTLAFMNAQGATPVLALTPLHPGLRKIIEQLGWTTRHKQVVDYIESLKGRYRFKFVDLTDTVRYPFDPGQFYDGVHMTTVNTRRAIDDILQATGGFTPVRPESGQ